MGKHIRPVVRALLYEQGQTMLDRAIAAQAKDRKTVTVDAAHLEGALRLLAWYKLRGKPRTDPAWAEWDAAELADAQDHDEFMEAHKAKMAAFWAKYPPRATP